MTIRRTLRASATLRSLGRCAVGIWSENKYLRMSTGQGELASCLPLISCGPHGILGCMELAPVVEQPDIQPFGQRLQQLLAAVQPPRTQAWLAEQSGVPASTISRLIKGDRGPTFEHLSHIAPVFGLNAATLAQNTDAEARIHEAGEWVRLSDFQELTKKLSEYEAKINDLEAQARASREAAGMRDALLKQTHGDLGKVHHDLACALADLAEARGEHEQTRKEKAQLEGRLKQYSAALTNAVAEVASLRAKLKELAEELKSTTKSSRAAAILAGVAAVTSMVTAASYFTRDNNTPNEDPADGTDQT